MSEPIRDENQAEQVQTPAPQPPLAWHGFQRKFLLIVIAVVSAFQAAWIFTGKIYYTPAVRDQLYAGMPGLRIADDALAVCLLAAAALLIFARSKLKGWKLQGLRMLQAGYALLALAQPVHALVRCCVAGLSPVNIPVLAQLLGYGALLLVNFLYYRRRRDLFQ